MPRGTPDVKIEHTRRLGAEVLLHGADFDEAAAHARALARERGLALVHPYDDLRVIAGQGTVALEMLEDAPELDAIVAPVGGGGLLAGCAVAAQETKPGIEMFGVEAARFPSMRQALRGEAIRCGPATLAEGIAVKEPGRLTLPIVRERAAEVLLVEEAAIEHAVLLLLEIEKTVVEGAGATPLAAVLEHRERFAGRRVGLVLSGGNIDLLPLASILERGLVRTKRLVRLRVAVRDVPGSLADLARLLADAHANIIQVEHHRAFTSLSLEKAEVELVLQTRGAEHAREIVSRLRAAGYDVEADD
jgi:threonine dehydratase